MRRFGEENKFRARIQESKGNQPMHLKRYLKMVMARNEMHENMKDRQTRREETAYVENKSQASLCAAIAC
jgi:hypothetical protein